MGNMIELKNPTARIVHIAARPPVIIDVVTNAAAASRRPQELSLP